MQFVALDLETTGLNPKKDTIIEIAAIKFSLTKKSGKFCVENFEEKTMLIDPKIPLEPEVTLVTGITPQMLHGKKIWSEVREKVADFIGDAVVVGHNILFDKEVLENHDINLENNIFLDTFELAGMISLDAKSLNLGFLAEFYDIKKR